MARAGAARPRSGVRLFAFVFGARYAFGGPPQSLATLVFGTWFLAALVLAFRAIRRRGVAAHRRWMIRAFAVGLAVGTIRLWVGLFVLTGWVDFRGELRAGVLARTVDARRGRRAVAAAPTDYPGDRSPSGAC